MTPRADAKKADFVFEGFLWNGFPLGSAGSTMTLLYQRVITSKYVAANDTRARVYYNLVVLFRLLWHHRILESTLEFWDTIFDDFPAKFGKAENLRVVAAHYVSAREAFHQRYGARSGDGFLARLVDQWRTRLPIDKDVARLVHQAAGVYSHFARESWAAVLRSQHQRLVSSKQMNWPVLVNPSLDKIGLASDLSMGVSGLYLSSTSNNGSRKSPNLARTPIFKHGSQVSPHSLPSTLQGKSDRAPNIQQGSLWTAESNREPGRLTPPVELRPLRQNMMIPEIVEPRLAGQKNSSDNAVEEAESSILATPGKHPASESDELSPFSKRRRFTQIAYGESNRNGEEGFGQTQGGERVDEASIQPQQRENAKGPASHQFDVPTPSAELQSLEEMIVSAAGRPSGRGESGTMPQPSPVLSQGFTFPMRDAPAAEAQETHGIPRAVTLHENPTVLIDMPRTIFAFARRIENLERAAGEQVKAEGGMTKLEKIVQEQGDIRAAVSDLSGQFTDLEKAGADREEVSASASAMTSALTGTIKGLEKKLGEATDTRTTIVALTRRITEIEKTTAERAAMQACKMRDLEKTVEMQSKILEGLGLKEAGEIVE